MAFASQTVPKNERARTQIDKEATAIVFWCKKLHEYLYGREFELWTDQKPLMHIFGPYKSITIVAATRLQRLLHYLSAFKYNIQYVESEKNGNANGLSQLPQSDYSDAKKDFEEKFYMFEICGR